MRHNERRQMLNRDPDRQQSSWPLGRLLKGVKTDRVFKTKSPRPRPPKSVKMRSNSNHSTDIFCQCADICARRADDTNAECGMTNSEWLDNVKLLYGHRLRFARDIDTLSGGFV